jgi:hypothetical protein
MNGYINTGKTNNNKQLNHPANQNIFAMKERERFFGVFRLSSEIFAIATLTFSATLESKKVIGRR